MPALSSLLSYSHHLILTLTHLPSNLYSMSIPFPLLSYTHPLTLLSHIHPFPFLSYTLLIMSVSGVRGPHTA